MTVRQPAERVLRESHVPLYLQIEEELRGRVESGEIRPLSQVPSEVDLAQEFGVSRMTARKAVDRLVAAGVLFRQTGKGTFVAAPKIAHGISMQLSFSAAMRSLGLDHRTRVLASGVMTAPANIARALDLPPGALIVHLRRLRIVEQAPAALHETYLPASYAGILTGDLTGSLTALMRGVGAEVAESRDSVEAVVALGDDARVLKVAEGSPLIRIESIACSASGEPLHYSEGLYRGDRFRFNLGTSRSPDLEIELKA